MDNFKIGFENLQPSQLYINQFKLTRVSEWIRTVLKRNWNNYCFIEDVRVDGQYKGKGIGRQLIEVAKEWTFSKGLKGMTLETQNINVSACKFYEKCGFILGGFDNFFYKQIESVKDEIVLYWYYINE